MLFGFLLLLGVTAAIHSFTVIPVSAQNMTNLSLTESEPLGILTITAQQLKELENSMNDIRQGLEQGSIIQAIVNLTTLEGQDSILAEETQSICGLKWFCISQMLRFYQVKHILKEKSVPKVILSRSELNA